MLKNKNLSTITFLLALIFFKTPGAQGIVSGPESSVADGEWLVDSHQIEERGKFKPMENPASWQDSKIDMFDLGVSRGIGSINDLLQEQVVRIGYKNFSSNEEKIGEKIYHTKDQGYVGTLGYSLKLVNESNYSLGLYATYAAIKKLSNKKFANPRVDAYQLGVFSSVLIHDYVFYNTLIHFGSGLKDQNRYLLTSFYLGLRAGSPGKIEPALRVGPYFEFDISDREDAAYAADYGTNSTEDKIRQIKYAMALYLDLNIYRKYVLSFGRLKKLVGQDVRSTSASQISLAAKF